jgi:uncharacterized protein YbjT (DUF2867 family)
MVIVTGAAGKTGGEVVRLLSSRGIRVRALVRDPARTKGLSGPGIEVVVGDLSKPHTLDPAFRGADKLFLVSSPALDVETLHGNALEAAKRTGIRHVVRLSARGASQSAPCTLIKVHGDVDENLSRSGLSYSILRPNYFFQNTLMSMSTIAGQGTLFGVNGDRALSMLDTRDVALAAVSLLTGNGHSGRVYNLTGPAAISHRQVAEKLSAALDRPVRFEEVTPDQARQGLSAIMPEWLVNAFLEMVGTWNETDAEITDVFERLTTKKARPYDAFAKDYASAFGATAKPAVV